MGRMTKAMPFVVGKKVGAPDGTSVVFVVATSTDPDGGRTRTIAVVVDGRASVVDDASARPGRGPSGPRPAGVHRARHGPLGSDRRPRPAVEVAFEGDEALGRQVVEQLNFMV